MTIDGISASDLFAQHAYIRTDTGIYYSTTTPGGFRLNYVSNSDVASVFFVLATGLRPYSPGDAWGGVTPSSITHGPWAFYDGAPTSHDDASGSSGPGNSGSNDSTVAGAGFASKEPGAIQSDPVLVAAPEPASAALALAGLAGLLLLGSSRRR